ncbi:LOG family protein [bacterium]|jgi:uncharacterized protein (TIGR00730 family)|nr:LOG family protein [bacterium]MBT6832109.1 LOG family protein [bacterium]MBT6996069.1 LOG family protein [bacterium]MBT7772518.1 LOG family protein [bacterium]
MTNEKPFPIEDELIPEKFRVAIFGSARTQPEDEFYKTTFSLAEEIGKHDIDIVTGGGPGLMEAANYGHKMGSSADSKSIGLTIELPHENSGNKHLDIKKHFLRFSNRLETFMKLSNVVVVMPGGVGTALELFYAWQLVQVAHVPKMPIILHGKMWHKIKDFVRDELLSRNLISPEDLNFVYCVENNEQAEELIFDFYEQHKKHGDGHLLDSKKYEL